MSYQDKVSPLGEIMSCMSIARQAGRVCCKAECVGQGRVGMQWVSNTLGFIAFMGLDRESEHMWLG
jgi:hypothetical protein